MPGGGSTVVRGIDEVSNKYNEVPMKHGTMYDNIATDIKFIIEINGKKQDHILSVPSIINKYLCVVEDET